MNVQASLGEFIPQIQGQGASMTEILLTGMFIKPQLNNTVSLDKLEAQCSLRHYHCLG